MRLLKQAPDRRRHPRISIQLPARYVLADRCEYTGTIVDVSAGGLALCGPKVGAPGERVVIYAERLGRVMGGIARRFDGGFAVELNMSGIAGRRFVARLMELEPPQNTHRQRQPFWRLWSA